MARETVIRLVDDVDGTPATETLRLEVNRVSYEIDLSKANADRFRQELDPWLAAARRTSRRRTTKR